MTALSLAQREIVDERRLINAERKRTADEQAKLLTWFNDEQARLLARFTDECAKLVSRNKELTEKDETLQERWQALSDVRELASVPLAFDTKKRIIRWDKGQIRLGRISFSIVKVLYDADGQELTKTDLEEKVWGEIFDETFRSVMYKLERQKLAPCYFPYIIVSAKCNGWIFDGAERRMEQTDGYRLIPR